VRKAKPLPCLRPASGCPGRARRAGNVLLRPVGSADASTDLWWPWRSDSAAATTLIKLLLDQNTPASVRARVADSIFNHAAKAIEIEDIEARVSDLERAAETTKQSR
jgi:hypothetical protein